MPRIPDADGHGAVSTAVETGEMSAAAVISLIVCTRNRAERLQTALSSIRQLSFDRPWELIVVDNGSTDGTARLVESFAREFDGRVISLGETRPGLGRAHMRGFSASSGEIVALIDDDCYPAPDYLEQVHRCFEEQPSLGFLGGRILLHDDADLPMTLKTSESRCDLKAESFVPAGFVHGANIAFRREALLEVGGFDVSLGPGTPFNCEDVDVVARLSAAGWAGAYDPRPVVRHHHGRRTSAEADALRRSYDHGRGAYYAKCLLNAQTRAICRGHIAWVARHQGLGRTWREARGAIHYLATRLTKNE